MKKENPYKVLEDVVLPKENERTLICQDFFQKMIKDMYKDKSYCDIIFLVGKDQVEVPANRYLVSCMSEVFRNMLYGNMIESKKEKIPLLDEDPRVFQNFINFLMTGEITFEFKDLLSIFVLADKYFVHPLKNFLFKEMSENITKDNVLSLFNFSFHFSQMNKEVQNKYVGMIGSCPEDLIRKKEQICVLSEEVLIRFIHIIKKYGFWGKPLEYELLLRIIDWVKANVTFKENFEHEESQKAKEICKNLIMKYVDFKYLEPKRFNDIRNFKLFDVNFLFELQIFVRELEQKEKVPEQSDLLPKKCSTLGNLFDYLDFPAGVPFDVEKLKTKKGIDCKIPQGYASIHDGGSCYGLNKIFSHFGNNNNGRNLYIYDFDKKQTQTLNIGFPTHGSYPLYDEISKSVFLLESDNGSHTSQICKINGINQKKFSLKSGPNRAKFTRGCIVNRRLYHVSAGREIIFYDIEKNDWTITKTKVTYSDKVSFIPHKTPMFLWVRDNSSINLYNIKKDCYDEISVMKCKTAGGGNRISCPLFTTKGYYVFCNHSYSSSIWDIVDPYEKKTYTMDWFGSKSDYSGHFFINGKEKAIYFNLNNKWKKIQEK